MNIFLFALAIAPVIIILVYIYQKDKFQKEPWWLLLITFIGGIFSVNIVFFLDMLIPENISESHFLQSLYTAGIKAGLLEELSKFIMLYLIIWKSRHFDEYIDGIVYAVFISMGFAAFENVGYISQYGGGISFNRAILAIPAHFLFAVSMGYFFSLARLFPRKRKHYLLLTLFIPALLHFCYDLPLMLIEGDIPPVWSGLLTVIFYGIDILLWIIGMRRLKKVQRMSDYERIVTD